MRENKSIKKNFFYNFSLNFINILFPLIVLPYVSRVLGVVNLGEYNFSLSLANWFLIFATFGTTNYGIREIAKNRNNRKDLDKTFSEIFFINFISTTITLIIYIIIIFTNHKTNSQISLFVISALMIFMNLFCIDWFYMGIEDFKVIALRSWFIKIVCLISIFIFVRNRNDYIVYALISAIAFGFANIFNFAYSKKYVKLIYKDLNLKKHINKLLIFFLSSLVISMYATFDQVFLGFISTNKDVAFYSRSRQVYSIALSITLSISTVLLPKLAYLVKNDFENYKKIIGKSIKYIYIFSVPSVLGLIVLSKDIMWVLGGKEFQGAYISLIILSILVFTVSLGTWQYSQLFVPLGREKVGLQCQIFIALVSICSNIVLIPKYGYIGASISLVLAEISGTIYGVYYAKTKIKEVKVNYITKSLLKSIFASLIMALAIMVFKLLKYGYIFNIMFGTFIGVVVYFGILYLMNDDICREFINYFLNKIKKISENNNS